MIQNKDKCMGAMLSAGIGDALGWAFSSKNNYEKVKFQDEYISWKRSMNESDFRYSETILEGEYSSNIQMLFIVSRSIIMEDWIQNFTMKELPFWLKYERDDDRLLTEIAYCYSEKQVPWLSDSKDVYFNFDKTGAVQVLPNVISKLNEEIDEEIDEILIDVALNISSTNGHPRAILSAMCYGYAIYTILNKTTTLNYGELISNMIENIHIWGKLPISHFPDTWIKASKEFKQYNFIDVWNKTLEGMKKHLEFILNSLENGILCHDEKVLKDIYNYDKEYDTGEISVLSALYLFSKYATNPTLAIKTAVVMKNHYVASITASLAGALFGTDYIPFKWQNIQDSKCFANICEILLSNNMKEYAKKITKSNSNETKVSTIIGKVKLLESNILRINKTQMINIDKYNSLLEQSIYIKTFKIVSDVDIMHLLYSNTNEINYVENIEMKNDIIKSDKKISLDSLYILAEELDKSRIGFKKVVNIIKDLEENGFSVQAIMKKYDVDDTIVDIIKKCLKVF